MILVQTLGMETMKKKRNKQYKPRAAYAPPLVVCTTTVDADLQNHVRLEKLRNGTAQDSDYNWLLDTQAALMLGAHKAGDAQVAKAAMVAQITLRSIRERFERTGKFGCTGEEFGTLCAMLEISEEFWKRASANTLKWAWLALEKARVENKGEIYAIV